MKSITASPQKLQLGKIKIANLTPAFHTQQANLANQSNSGCIIICIPTCDC
jgi:hypothetical protein